MLYLKLKEAYCVCSARVWYSLFESKTKLFTRSILTPLLKTFAWSPWQILYRPYHQVGWLIIVTQLFVRGERWIRSVNISAPKTRKETGVTLLFPKAIRKVSWDSSEKASLKFEKASKKVPDQAVSSEELGSCPTSTAKAKDSQILTHIWQTGLFYTQLFKAEYYFLYFTFSVCKWGLKLVNLKGNL